MTLATMIRGTFSKGNASICFFLSFFLSFFLYFFFLLFRGSDISTNKFGGASTEGFGQTIPGAISCGFMLLIRSGRLAKDSDFWSVGRTREGKGKLNGMNGWHFVFMIFFSLFLVVRLATV